MRYLSLLMEHADEIANDRTGRKAFAWIVKYLPGVTSTRPAEEEDRPDEVVLWDYPKGDRNGQPLDWKAEWPRFRKNLAAVRWIMDGRMGQTSRRRVMPPAVRKVVEEYVSRLRINVVGQRPQELRLAIVIDNAPVLRPSSKGAVEVVSLDEFWQLVVASAVDPNFNPFLGNICRRCCKPLVTTPTGRPSRARYCRDCYQQAWIDENRDKARRMWVKSKAKMREAVLEAERKIRQRHNKPMN